MVRSGALRGGAKPIFAPAGALGRGEAILRPGWGVGAGRSYFAPRAGALGRGAYVFWALWCAPGRLYRPSNNKYEVWKYIFIDFFYKKRSKKLEKKIYFIDFYKKKK